MRFALATKFAPLGTLGVARQVRSGQEETS